MTALHSQVNDHTRRGRPDDTKLSRNLNALLNDLAAAEALRRQQLNEIGQLRSEIYQIANQRGISGSMLRAVLKVQRGKVPS